MKENNLKSYERNFENLHRWTRWTRAVERTESNTKVLIKDR